MDIDVSAEAKNKRLNRRVAITVVALSVFMGLGNIKDGNIVQAMAEAKADSVDRWNEYQATKTKQHIAEAARMQVLALTPAREAATGFDAAIAKYSASAPALAGQAKALSAKYDALNLHDDQFDASEALISTAISIAAVAALAESEAALVAAWVFGAFGVFMGVCGFAGWAFHPDVLSNFLG